MNAPQLLETIRGRGGKITVARDQTGAAKIQIAPRGIVGDFAGEIALLKPLLLKILATAPDEKAPETRRIAPQRAQTDDSPKPLSDDQNAAQIAQNRVRLDALDVATNGNAAAAIFRATCELDARFRRDLEKSGGAAIHEVAICVALLNCRIDPEFLEKN